MSFQQGLSGLNAASNNLATIGNNVANASTIGFKAARAEFSDMYAAALGGASSNTIGIGTNLFDLHSPREHMDHTSAARVWPLIKDVMKSLDR